MAQPIAQENKIGIIIGSVRGKRIGPSVATFVKETVESSLSTTTTNPATPPLTLDLIDLATFDLPVFTESLVPATVPKSGTFKSPAAQRWRAAIQGCAAYILVSAEYNYGMPGAIKNALDYLYNDWIDKPIMVVTYGISGGFRASDGLKMVLEGMKLRVVRTRPQLAYPGADKEKGVMSPDLYKAMGGVVGEESLKAWMGQREEIEKGFEELKALLLEKDKEVVDQAQPVKIT